VIVEAVFLPDDPAGVVWGGVSFWRPPMGLDY
jgi:hypothetical protein